MDDNDKSRDASPLPTNDIDSEDADCKPLRTKKVKLESKAVAKTPKKKKSAKRKESKEIKSSPSTSTKEDLNKSIGENADSDNDDLDQEIAVGFTDDLPDYVGKFGIEEEKVDRFKLSVPHVNLQHLVVDEIGLEGLDGITIEALWTRLSIATKQSLPLPFCIQKYVWDIVRSRKDIHFYELQTPREKFVMFDRFQNIDPDLGASIDPVVPPVDIYPYHPVKEKIVLGSAVSYDTRKVITNQVRNLTLHELESRYGTQLVMVGTQKLRIKVLINPLADPNIELTAPQYCLLERIGRSRRHGEITQGKMSLQIISKDPKILFYNRKILVDNNLITKQAFVTKISATQHSTGSLLQLTRFYNEKKTKTQIMTEQIVDVLRKRPFYRMEHAEAKKVFGNTRALSKLFKLQDFQRFVKTDVHHKYRELYPNAPLKEWKQKGSDKEKRIRTIELINSNVNIGGSWNEDDPKEESSDDEEMKQLIYNSPILHQVYEYIKLGGIDGRSLKEIQYNKGLDFYSIRAAVNQLVNRNLVAGVKIDIGRQRIIKYHMICSNEIEATYVNEPGTSTQNELEEEALEFLSEFLEVEPELLKPPPASIQELDNTTDKSNVSSAKGNYALIKQLREQIKVNKEKFVGYKTKAGESLLYQFLSQKEKFKSETMNVVAEDTCVIADNAETVAVDPTVHKNDNLSQLEKIFKNQHSYVTEPNVLSTDLINKSTCLKNICQELCHSSASKTSHIKNKKKNKKRKRLFSKIKQINTVPDDRKAPTAEDVLENYLCPLKFNASDISFDRRYHKLRNRVIKLVTPILSHFHYRIKVLMPKKRYMLKKKMTRSELVKFSQDHPMLNSDVPLPNLEQQSMFDSILIDNSELKRKAEQLETEDPKRLKLDDSVANEAPLLCMGPNPTVAYHEVDEDNIEITVMASSKPEEFDDTDYKYIKENNATLRTLKRASCIVEAVRQEKVITDVRRLHRMIQTQDNEEGYNVKIDKKSIERIYTRLVKSGHIKVLQIILKSSEIRRSLMVICDPSLDIQHSMIESVIEQLKMKFFITARKRDWDLMQTKLLPTDKDASAFDTSEITSSVGELKLLSNKDSPYLYNRNIGKDYGHAPKFMRMRVLHEFLFHLIYNYPHDIEPVDIKEMLNECDVMVDDNIINEMPRVFYKEVSWRMFVPPLPKHSGWDDGWALVCDILLRLPLSLFVKLYNVSFVIPELPAYLEHPIKQFYLVKHLPSDIRNGLLHRRKYMFSIHETLARLCYIGILQFGPQKLREKDQLFIFLNRRGTLLDTTTSNAGYHYVEEKEYKKLDYHFSTAMDVETYWYEMWNICAHSKLGLRNTVTGTYITIEQVDTKPAMLEAMKPKTPESAIKADDGTVPGDRRGAAGLDSALWSHIKRNWVWCSHVVKSSQSAPDQSPAEPTPIMNKKPKEKSGDLTQTIKRAQLKAKKVADAKSEENPLSPVTQSRRRTYKKSNVLPPKNKKQEQIKKGRWYIRKVLPRVDIKKKRDYDVIDRKLMENLKHSRSEWNDGEDRVLHICKIVSTFLCPNYRKQVVPYTVIRDVLHKLSPCSNNKTSGACQRRLNVIFGPSEQQEFLQQIVKLLSYTPYVTKYFKTFCQKIEAGSTLSDKQLHGIFVYLATYFYTHQHEIHHILEAVAYKYQFETNIRKSKQKDDSRSSGSETLPKTSHQNLPEYVQSIGPPEIVSYDCTELTSSKAKTSKLYMESPDFPRTEADVVLDTIKSVIHSTIGSRQDEVSWIYQLFRVYQNYSDDMLKTALTEVRNSQMVSIKRSYMRKYNEAEGLPITTKLFQFSYYYCFTQITKFPPELFLEAHEMFLGIANNNEGLGTGLPMECFEQGHSVGLAEVATNIETYFNVDIPKEVLLLNPNIADHSELIKELAVRYKKMLTLVKEGTYFKDDTDDTNDSIDQVDFYKQEKAKYTPRTPMIQRFLKSWFLADETDETDEDVGAPELTIVSYENETREEVVPSTIIEGSFGKKLDEFRSIKSDKKRKRANQMTSEESKKILESLNPKFYAKSQSVKAVSKSGTPKRTELPNPISRNYLSFEDYEKELESLLSSKVVDRDETSQVIVDDIQREFEGASGEDTQDSFTDFSDNDTNILEKYLCSKRSLITKTSVSEDTNLDQVILDEDAVDFSQIVRSDVQSQIMEDSNPVIQSISNSLQPKLDKADNVDPMTNAQIQYLMNDELTVEQIMEQMLVECPSEERKIPKPINLARLLVKGLFPELDEDEERLERLHQHFVIICPDTNLLWSDISESEDFNYLFMQHSQTCKRLLRKVQMDIIVSDNFASNREFVEKLKNLGGTEFDISITESLIDFVCKKRVIGASVKQLREHFSQLEKLKLSTILQTLTDMNILIRTGICHIVFVHHKYRKNWLVESCSLGDQDRLKLKETQVEETSDVDLPTLAKSLETCRSYTEIKLRIMPWARIDGTLNLKIFEKWMCTVLGYCLSDAMVPLMNIIHLCTYLKPVDVYYLVECLEELGCVRMVTYKIDKPTLFSKPNYTEAVTAELIDEFEDICVETNGAAVIKFGTLLNKKLKEFDFPSDETKKHGTF